jgi:hypothetical protein
MFVFAALIVLGGFGEGPVRGQSKDKHIDVVSFMGESICVSKTSDFRKKHG